MFSSSGEQQFVIGDICSITVMPNDKKWQGIVAEVIGFARNTRAIAKVTAHNECASDQTIKIGETFEFDFGSTVGEYMTIINLPEDKEPSATYHPEAAVFEALF